MNQTYQAEGLKSFEHLIRQMIQVAEAARAVTFSDSAVPEDKAASHEDRDTHAWQTIVGSIVMLLSAKQVASQIPEPRSRNETLYSLQASIAKIIAKCRTANGNKNHPISDSSFRNMIVTGLALMAESYASGSLRNELLQIVTQINAETDEAVTNGEQEKIVRAQATEALNVRSPNVNSQRVTLYTPSVNDLQGSDD